VIPEFGHHNERIEHGIGQGTEVANADSNSCEELVEYAIESIKDTEYQTLGTSRPFGKDDCGRLLAIQAIKQARNVRWFVFSVAVHDDYDIAGTRRVHESQADSYSSLVAEIPSELEDIDAADRGQ
jgi:hypothetical protein